MALIDLREIHFGYGGAPLLDGVSLRIEPGERLGLLGRNGEGKSTLLKIVAGEIDVEAGSSARQRGLRVSRLEQEVPRDLSGSVAEVVTAGLGGEGKLLRRYHEVSARADTHGDALAELEHLQRELDAAGAWQLEREVERVLSRLDLDGARQVTELSAGVLRRVLLARALVNSPDLLLLDEPTNHLDVDSILWLEEFLLRSDAALLFVTHDRAFLSRLATRILELDRGTLRSWDGDYRHFLTRREEVLAAEWKQWTRQDEKLAREEAWMRKGIRARRTRNEGRVRALEALRAERSARRERRAGAQAEIDVGERSGRLVIEAKGLGFAFVDRPIVRDLSLRILRGDKVGLIGPNGIGKSTLLELLLGTRPPQHGSVRHGTKLRIARFDQLDGELDETLTLLEYLRELGGEFVEIGGRQRHLHSYLEDFLFTPERARSRIANLSGGERNRLRLARLFAQPANVLVLDEPTNDLDLETLELLESLLVDYTGTVLVVSHDRAFLDDVATSCLVFEGDGLVEELVGGYRTWQRRRDARAAAARAAAAKSPPGTPCAPPARKRLSYMEQRELEELPARIEELEAEIEGIHVRLSDPELYRRGGPAISETRAELARAQDALAEAYSRWESLEERAGPRG